MLSRRAMMRASAAGALAGLFGACVELRPQIDRERILKLFCDDSERVRYDLTAPFQHGSLTYATDARWMCRAELTSPVINGERRIPRVDDCWQKLWHPAGEFVPLDLPPIESLTRASETDCPVCPQCGNRRVSYGTEYPEFGEDGWVKSKRLRMLDWDVDTNTYRDPSCERCRGLPYAGPSQLFLDGVLFDYWRSKTFSEVPGVRVVRSAAESDCLLFVGEGFEGMAMGIARG